MSLPGSCSHELGVLYTARPLISRDVRRKGVALLSAAEEQTARAISAYERNAFFIYLQMGSMN